MLKNDEALQRATKAVKAKFNQGVKRNQLGKWEQSIVNIEHIIMLIYVCVCVCVYDSVGFHDSSHSHNTMLVHYNIIYMIHSFFHPLCVFITNDTLNGLCSINIPFHFYGQVNMSTLSGRQKN